MKIRKLLDILECADSSLRVFFDFAECIPTTINSWRGVYSEPALGWVRFDTIDKHPTVESLIKEIKAAINGRIFTGWKGGEYTYTDDNILHVDNPGYCSHTEINHITIGRYSVILHTINNKN